MRGRPLRFLVLTLGAWTMGRVAMLTMEGDPPAAIVEAFLPPVRAAARPSAAIPPRVRRTASKAPIPLASVWLATARRGRPEPGRLTLQQAQKPPPSTATSVSAGVGTSLPPPLPPTPVPRPPGRWAGSIWAVGRGAGDGGGVPGAQLGGSQAGMRLSYALDADRRIALAGRVSTPLEGRGREAALGIEWRPFAAPLRLLAEQRWSLDGGRGGRGGPTVMLVEGLPPTRIGPVIAEAYAQVGAIARGRVDGFADGAARLAAPVPAGKLDLDLGVGAWGGAQPGAARVDIGPSLGLRVPVGARRVRVTLDWRQRVAGRARPGSGPALSIGSDF